MTPLAFGGVPYVTDDPGMLDFQHWEVDVASVPGHNAGGWSGTLPQVELDYGVLPNLNLHIIMPTAFSAPSHGIFRMGYGDTELGIKYRLIGDSDRFPDVAFFPLFEVPTGDFNRGLGTGHFSAYLPLWMQKTMGKWTVFGGGGYWFNPGVGNQNWGFTGGALQYQVAKSLAIGTEIFHETAQTKDGESDTVINPGLIWDLSERSHILLSAGHTIQGHSRFLAYAGVQFTFGPEKEKSGAGK